MPKTEISQILKQFQPQQNIYIAGSCAEPRPFVEALSQQADTLPKLNITHSFVPGVNTVKLATEDNELTETAIFPRSPASKINVIPTTYYGYHQYLSQQNFDWAVVQVSPPDNSGRCCLGPSVEFMPTVLKRSRKLIGVINPQMAAIEGSHFINLAEFDVICEIDAPLVTYDAGKIDSASEKISQYLATLINDGDTLQLGLGKVPTQLLENLKNHRDLRFHTGLLTRGFLSLLNAGAISKDYRHTTCASLGNAEFYRQLGSVKNLNIAGVSYTHAPETLAKLESLIAVNSALQVDLFGRANLEYMGDRKISSAGGAPNFANAAYQSNTGKSIIALPATAAKGTISRIQKSLDPTHAPSLDENQIDYVVTEYGIAPLAGKTQTQRAEVLRNIAAPEFRDSLF